MTVTVQRRAPNVDGGTSNTLKQVESSLFILPLSMRSELKRQLKIVLVEYFIVLHIFVQYSIEYINLNKPGKDHV